MATSGLGGLLVEEGLLSDLDRRTIKRTCGSGAAAFAKAVVTLGLLDEDELAAFLAERTPHRVADKDMSRETQAEALGAVDTLLLERLEVVPLKLKNSTLSVAVADPLDRETLAQLEFFTGYKIEPVIATFSQIASTLQGVMKNFQPSSSNLEEFLTNHALAATHKLHLVDAPSQSSKETAEQSRAPIEAEAEREEDDVKGLLDDLVDEGDTSATSDDAGLDDGPEDELDDGSEDAPAEPQAKDSAGGDGESLDDLDDFEDGSEDVGDFEDSSADLDDFEGGSGELAASGSEGPDESDPSTGPEDSKSVQEDMSAADFGLSDEELEAEASGGPPLPTNPSESRDETPSAGDNLDDLSDQDTATDLAGEGDALSLDHDHDPDSETTEKEAATPSQSGEAHEFTETSDSPEASSEEAIDDLESDLESDLSAIGLEGDLAGDLANDSDTGPGDDASSDAPQGVGDSENEGTIEDLEMMLGVRDQDTGSVDPPEPDLESGLDSELSHVFGGDESPQDQELAAPLEPTPDLGDQATSDDSQAGATDALDDLQELLNMEDTTTGEGGDLKDAMDAGVSGAGGPEDLADFSPDDLATEGLQSTTEDVGDFSPNETSTGAHDLTTDDFTTDGLKAGTPGSDAESLSDLDLDDLSGVDLDSTPEDLSDLTANEPGADDLGTAAESLSDLSAGDLDESDLTINHLSDLSIVDLVSDRDDPNHSFGPVESAFDETDETILEDLAMDGDDQGPEINDEDPIDEAHAAAPFQEHLPSPKSSSTDSMIRIGSLNRALLGLTMAADRDAAIARTAKACADAGMTRGILYKMDGSEISVISIWNDATVQMDPGEEFVTPRLGKVLERLYAGWTPFNDVAREENLKPFDSWRTESDTLMAALVPSSGPSKLAIVVSWGQDAFDDGALRLVALDVMQRLGKRV